MRRKNLKDKLDGIIGVEKDNLQTFLIAKIVEIDNKKLFASIKIIDIPKILGTHDELPIINNVPIMPIFYNQKMQIYAPYSVGDKVLVAFLKYDTFNARNSDDPVEPDTTSQFDLNHGLIVGSITRDSENIVYDEAFSIIYESTELKIDETGVFIVGDTKITGDLTVTGDIKGDSNLSIEGDVKINGNLTVNGKTQLKTVEAQSLKVNLLDAGNISGKCAIVRPEYIK